MDSAQVGINAHYSIVWMQKPLFCAWKAYSRKLAFVDAKNPFLTFRKRTLENVSLQEENPFRDQ